MSAILKRELNAYFSSATAYVVMAVFFFFSGLFFNYYCISANSSSLSYVFGIVLGYVFLGEVLSPVQFLAVTLIMSGVILIGGGDHE